MTQEGPVVPTLSRRQGPSIRVEAGERHLRKQVSIPTSSNDRRNGVHVFNLSEWGAYAVRVLVPARRAHPII